MKIVEIPVKRRPRFRWLLYLSCCLLGVWLALSAIEPPAETTAAEPVAAPVVDYQQDFFADYRAERAVHRDEQEECYRSLLDNEELPAEQRAAYNDELVQSLREAQAEDELETILRGRGYEDALLIRGEAVTFLVLRAAALSAGEKDELITLVASYAAIDSQQITVFSVQ